jgi:hypothetical protein
VLAVVTAGVAGLLFQPHRSTPRGHLPGRGVAGVGVPRSTRAGQRRATHRWVQRP